MDGQDTQKDDMCVKAIREARQHELIREATEMKLTIATLGRLLYASADEARALSQALTVEHQKCIELQEQLKLKDG